MRKHGNERIFCGLKSAMLRGHLTMSAVRMFIPVFACLAIASGTADDAAASPSIRYGVQDDAWLLGGPGSYNSRLRFLKQIGVDVVRVNVRWNEIAGRRPARPTRHTDRQLRVCGRAKVSAGASLGHLERAEQELEPAADGTSNVRPAAERRVRCDQAGQPTRPRRRRRDRASRRQ